MNKKIDWIKYLSPLTGIIFCPITILFLWSVWSGPVAETKTKIIEEVKF